MYFIYIYKADEKKYKVVLDSKITNFEFETLGMQAYDLRKIGFQYFDVDTKKSEVGQILIIAGMHYNSYLFVY